MDVSAVTRDEVIYVQAKSSNRETRTIPTSLNEKKETCKTQNFYIFTC